MANFNRLKIVPIVILLVAFFSLGADNPPPPPSDATNTQTDRGEPPPPPSSGSQSTPADTGAPPPPPLPLGNRGTVTDSITERPIAGVAVRVFDITGHIIALTRTNDSGSYTISDPLYGLYFIYAYSSGYRPKWMARYIRGGSNESIDFALQPINPPAHPPQITSVTPANNSEFLAGARVEIKAAATGPANGPPPEYRFLIGGTVARAWSTSDTYFWQTGSSDTGRVEITCEARNSSGAKSSRSIFIRILNPTPEDILRKVADNYAKIQDFKADMVLSSTLDGKPFGETEYCRYYFKAPNKEKTEAYTDSSRATLKEIMITDGPKMTMIDPVNNLRQEVDLLQETGLTSTQFDQKNIYYNHEAFLLNHTIAKNNSQTDFNNMVVALDAVPNIQNNLYSKMELYIDYNKGIVVKLCFYRRNEDGRVILFQSVETIESQEMPNRVYLPKQIRRIPLIKSGNLIETAEYNNIQLGLGLTDHDFSWSEQN